LNFPWPPIFYLLAFALAFGLEKIMPANMPVDWHISSRSAGLILISAAVALDLWSLVTLFKNHTTVMPNRPATRLVTGGPFRLTRNPIYLGYTLATLGFGLAWGSFWFVGAALLTAALTHLYAVRREERHLLARFGFEYERYCQRTRAWI
jgi:protein-S-isoprenylcysteine O-methyltransferase Ste14